MKICKTQLIEVRPWTHNPRPKDLLVFFYSGIACTQTLFYFSFRSFRKHRQERENWQSINLPRFIFLSHALDGLWRQNRGSVNRLMAVVQATASARAMPSHLAAVSIDTPSARLQTELSHLPNLYISLVGKEPDHMDNHWASDRHLWMLLTSFSSALSEQFILTRQFCLTLHLKDFRVSDYCCLWHFLYIGTRLIRTSRAMPFWDTKGTRHTGTPWGHAILGPHGDTPYWNTKGTRHTGTPWGHAILGHQGGTPNSVRRNDWSKKPRKWNLCKKKSKPLWMGHSTRVKHRRKGGLIKIKHAPRYFATVSSNKIVLIRNLQVTRGYENKLIVALIWASLNHWKKSTFSFNETSLKLLEWNWTLFRSSFLTPLLISLLTSYVYYYYQRYLHLVRRLIIQATETRLCLHR